MTRKLIIALFALGLISSAAVGAAPRGNMEEVLSQFIAEHAKEKLVWKKNILFIRDPSKVPAGWQLGQSEKGWYIFVPKTFSELSEAEKEDVKRDARLKSWLVSTLNGRRYPAIGAVAPDTGPGFFPVEGGEPMAAHEAATRTFTVTVDPIEAIRSREVAVELTEGLPR